MERLQAEYPALNIQWRSFELRPLGSPPIPPAYLARIEANRPIFEQTAREQHGLIIKSGPFGINSRKALVGAKFAEAHGAGAAYHQRVMAAYWQEAQSIAEPAVLESLAQEVGLPRAEFLAALDDPHYDQQVSEDVLLARGLEIQGVPALLFNRKFFISGAQPYPVLSQVIERILSGELA